MKRPEQDLQISVARFLDLAIPDFTWWHTPNGGGRSKVEGAVLKAMGVKAGVPDITIILPGPRVGFIELKAGKGTLTPAQKAFRDAVRIQGCPWAEARSLEGVWDILDGWLRPWGHSLKVRRP